MRRRIGILALLLALIPSALGQDLRAGRFLVAKPELRDPNFARTVVFLLEYGEEGAMGLVLNRPTEVLASNVITGIEALADWEETAFLGGPVGRRNAMILLRAEQDLEAANRVFRDVHVTGSRDILANLAGREDAVFRVYLGYSGWSPGQLEREIMQGSWLVVGGDVLSIFTDSPDLLWERLHTGATVRFAD